MDDPADVSSQNRLGQHLLDEGSSTRNRLHSSSARLLAARQVRAAEQALQQSRLAWPRGGQHLARHLPGRVPQRQRDHHHVIERADHRQELRQQVDRGRAATALPARPRP